MSTPSAEHGSGNKAAGQSVSRRTVLAGAAAGLIAASIPTVAEASSSPTQATVWVRPGHRVAPTTSESLGVNTACWDSLMLGATTPGLIRDAGLGLVRFPGVLDGYHWESNTYRAGGVEVPMPVSFDQFMGVVRAAHARSVITVNYGTGTPAEAAAWVRHANASPDTYTRYWQIGNEQYGTWELDDHPDPHTPESYAKYAPAYVAAMKDVDPTIRVGMDFRVSTHSGVLMDPAQDPWNLGVLRETGSIWDSIDVHWYPYHKADEPITAQQMLSSIDLIGPAMNSINTLVRTYAPQARIMVTETAMNSNASPLNGQPAAALFAAQNALTWLAHGATTVDWWILHGYQSMAQELALLSSGTNDEPAVDTPFPPYHGYLLASHLTRPDGHFVETLTSSPALRVFATVAQGDQAALMILNNDLSHDIRVEVSGLPGGLTRHTKVFRYSADSPTITTTMGVNGQLDIPPCSVTVLVNPH